MQMRIINPDWTGYRAAAWVCAVLIVLAIGVAGFAGSVFAGLVPAILLALAISALLVHRLLPNLFVLIFSLGALFGISGRFWNLYDKIFFYDELAHLLGGFAMTLVLGFYMYRSLIPVFKKRVLLFAFSFINLGLGIGVAWEVFEFYLTNARDGMTLEDTILDLVLDAVGSGLAVPLSLWYSKQLEEEN